MTDGVPDTFEAAWQLASSVPGWLTDAQARLLWNSAQELGEEPLLLEIGSHQGRSTLVLGSAVRGKGGHVVAVDPFVDGRLFGGQSTRDKFEANIANAGLESTVELLPDYSTRARPAWNRRLDLLYIDGKHDVWTFSDDLRWARHLPEGAPVLVHDCYSSIGVTLGVLRHVLPSKTLTYVRREGSLALFRTTPPTASDRLRILREVPWWLRNVGIKVLLRLRLRPVARLLGHSGPYDPF